MILRQQTAYSATLLQKIWTTTKHSRQQFENGEMQRETALKFWKPNLHLLQTRTGCSHQIESKTEYIRVATSLFHGSQQQILHLCSQVLIHKECLMALQMMKKNGQCSETKGLLTFSVDDSSAYAVKAF
jgi:hypothetical protein